VVAEDDVAQLFEGAPRFLVRLTEAGPFPDDDALFAAARSIAHTMPEREQIELVDGHPRLGAPPETVSAASFREQGYDRGPVGEPVTDLATDFECLNDAYEARFGFRYCVFVAGRSRAELLPGFEAAVDAPDRSAELHRAVNAVIDIARDRRARLAGRHEETGR
jgi:2-oxo-4-hydroxy-4-carboxy--5-ureidoimidazoline (OHCU) decarboxylase